MKSDTKEERGSENRPDVSRDLFDVVNNRRSIRHFTEKPVSDSMLDKILKAGIRAPYSAQLYTIVYTRDPEKIKKLRKINVWPSTKLLMIFFVDFRKLGKIILQKGYKYDWDDGSLLLTGIVDVCLVLQNVILAADALGLGSVICGQAPHYADLVSEVCKVPPRVFPVVGLSLGYPDKSVETDIRPRFPLRCSVFEDFYHDLSEKSIQECMRAMDEGYLTQGYYIRIRPKIPLKEGKDQIDYDRYSWSEHICRKFTQGRLTKETLLERLKKHGFDVV